MIEEAKKKNRRQRSQRNKIVTSIGALLTAVIPVVESVERMVPGTVPPGTSVLAGTIGTAVLTVINHVWPR
jgi:hypothetical protein